MTASAARTKASAKGRPRRKAGKAASKRKLTAALSIETVKDLSRALDHKTILGGVSALLVKSAVDHGVLALDEVHRFIPKSTFARKVRNHTSLSVEEGDRLARLARLKSYAGEVFQSRDDADTWLNERNPGLRGDAPIDLLLTDEGARRVELALRRIDYGDYS